MEVGRDTVDRLEIGDRRPSTTAGDEKSRRDSGCDLNPLGAADRGRDPACTVGHGFGSDRL